MTRALLAAGLVLHGLVAPRARAQVPPPGGGPPDGATPSANAPSEDDGARTPRVEQIPGHVEPPHYLPLRFDEDYRGLADAPTGDPLDPIKHVALGRRAWLSLGGQHRLRFQVIEGPSAGAASPPRTSEMFVRNLVHADLHAHPSARVFVQLGSSFALGNPPSGPPETDLFDVQQLFVEAHHDFGPLALSLRVGRQEMPLGSTRWVSARDGTNVRQTFDLVRLEAEGEGWSAESFFGFVPEVRRGVLDDGVDPDDRFFGSYWTFAFLDALHVEAFYLGRQRDAAYEPLEDGSPGLVGRETRHTLGLRFDGTLATGFEYIVHGLVQTGTLDAPATNARVLAWGFAGGLWQRLPGALSDVRVGVRWDALSGDERAGDRKLGTFHPLFPNLSFFAVLPTVHPENLYGVHPLVTFDRGPVGLSFGTIVFFRPSLGDAIFRPGGVLAPAQASDARRSGALLSLSFTYALARHLRFDAEYAHLFVGPGLAPVMSRDTDYFGTWLTLTY